jgi:hypothetical protein
MFRIRIFSGDGNRSHDWPNPKNDKQEEYPALRGSFKKTEPMAFTPSLPPARDLHELDSWVWEEEWETRWVIEGGLNVKCLVAERIVALCNILLPVLSKLEGESKAVAFLNISKITAEVKLFQDGSKKVSVRNIETYNKTLNTCNSTWKQTGGKMQSLAFKSPHLC